VPSSDPILRFQDIRDNIARIERFTARMDLQAFSANEETVYAVKHALLIIGEAAAKLGELASQLSPEIDWRDIRGLSNRLRHDYDNINVVLIWRIVERDLSPLKTAVEAALIQLRD
jgi:uncharacterized protein with HEPN domain